MPGVSVPNLVIARVGIDGKVSIYNNLGTINVAADIQGYFQGDATGSSYLPLTPARILDTRDRHRRHGRRPWARAASSS